MPGYVWLALVVFVLAVVAGAGLAGVRALAAWRSFRALRRQIDRTLEDLDRSVAGIESRLAKAGRTARRLEEARARLNESLATARVLADAFGETRAVVGGVTGIVPTK
jgi:hypothetical protein